MDVEVNNVGMDDTGAALRMFEQGKPLTIEYKTQSVSHTADADPCRHERLHSLRISHYLRFKRLRKVEDLRKSIEYQTQAIEYTPEGHYNLSERLHTLGMLHDTYFSHLGNPEDLEQAIEYKLKAQSLTPVDHPDIGQRLKGLGLSYSKRYTCLGDLTDLDNAIDSRTKSVLITPNEHPDKPSRLDSLSSSHYLRFERLGDLEDIQKDIEYSFQSVELTPEGHVDLPERLSNLSVSYHRRFKRLGSLDDLGKAIKYNLQALPLTQESSPYLPDLLSKLGTYLGDRFIHVGNLKDLDKSMEYELRAYSLTPPNDPNLPIRLAGLSVSHHERFKRLGDLKDIDKAIEFSLQAYSLASPDQNSELPINLAQSYRARFERLNNLDDLEKAIDYAIKGCSLVGEDSPKLSGRLGVLLSEKFNRLGNMDDLDKAIEYLTKVCSLFPEDHPELPSKLGSLGASYHNRFMYLSKVADLDKAIEYKLKASKLRPKTHPERPGSLSNLGTSYYERFVRLGNSSDLDKSLEYAQQAHDLYPEDHLTRPHSLSNLSTLAHLKFIQTNDVSLLHQAAECLRQAARFVGGNPRFQLEAALNWAALVSDHEVPQQLDCLEAYQNAIELIPEVIWLGATVTQRYANIEQLSNPADQNYVAAERLNDAVAQAASIAIQRRRFDLALEWLEQGRSIVWNQTSSLRLPLDELSIKDPTLAAQLQTVRDQLQILSLEDLAATTKLPSRAEQDIQQHRLAARYATLVSQVRQLEGFESFLRPRSAGELSAIARTGPVIVINIHQAQCDALIIKQGGIEHVPLPGLTYTTAQQMRTRMELSLGLSQGGIQERAQRRPVAPDPDAQQDTRQILSLLWDNVVEPLLDFLGYIVRVPEELPHITWCVTGPLTFLPIHAAGYYDRPRCKLSDYAVSSYTPTLSALLNSTCTPSNHSSIIAIGQRETSGFGSLPGTVKELEYIQKHAQERIQYKQLIESNATPTAVLDEMEQHDWIHLACHAHQSIADPRSSGFFLHGGTLDLHTITQRSFTGKGLAFLSACQTATGDTKLADEAVHLTSGILMAGYPSVIATMWAVGDSDAPFIADKVYGELMKGGKMNCRNAARALHYAVAQLREELGDDKFECWAPFIHIGS